MKWMTLIIVSALLTGCGVGKTEVTDTTRGGKSAVVFSKLISTGSNREITEAMTNFFRVGAPCSQYESVFSLADSKSTRDFGHNYVFRYRPTTPGKGGDLWVEVGADERSQTVEYVRPDGYKFGVLPNQVPEEDTARKLADPQH